MKSKHTSYLVSLVSRLLYRTILVCALFLVFGVSTGHAEREDLSRVAANSFLELLDAGNYIQAWWEGSELLHQTTDLDTWVAEQLVQRQLLGHLTERTIKGVTERTVMSGFPDGDYRIFVVGSRFEKKQKALELLILNKEPFEDWRVVSYRLR
ncbi:DUF4019 domain-containing protein [Geopsychrobacter electrodiphilus]|uniref:DUF4019 domain-containing protein n=1 Tax=Geopsychrobacter electrodiphilus TaxID=225196 RepID=UPI00036EE405|nr:DUF4019 domain-containing protein [Geopsychrobacter electrodiphilus]